jgi:antitoxin CptB
MKKEQRTYLIKKLLYKSNYRGCKETDLILGSFAHKYIDALSDNELLDFEVIVNEMDPDILDWLNDVCTVPQNISKSLLAKISNQNSSLREMK